MAPKKKIQGSRSFHPDQAKSHLDAAEAALALEAPLSSKSRRSFAALFKLDPTVMRMIVAIAQEDGLNIAIDPASIEDDLAYEAAASPIAQAARGLAQRIEDTILARRGRAANAAFAAYESMKGLVRLPQGEKLRPRLAEVQAMLRLGRKKKPAPAEPPPLKQAS